MAPKSTPQPLWKTSPALIGLQLELRQRQKIFTAGSSLPRSTLAPSSSFTATDRAPNHRAPSPNTTAPTPPDSSSELGPPADRPWVDDCPAAAATSASLGATHCFGQLWAADRPDSIDCGHPEHCVNCAQSFFAAATYSLAIEQRPQPQRQKSSSKSSVQRGNVFCRRPTASKECDKMDLKSRVVLHSNGSILPNVYGQPSNLLGFVNIYFVQG
jgi:hypothetical protein